METKKEKLGVYISFKKSEKGLYEELKKIDNYTQLVKDLLTEYIYGKSTVRTVSEQKIEVGIDDICKIIESATKNLNTIQTGQPATIENTKSKNYLSNNLEPSDTELELDENIMNLL